MIDIHSHIIPDLDDGPASVGESLDGLRRLAQSGVVTAIATPHLTASLIEDPNRLKMYLERADACCADMLSAATGAKMAPDIRRGFEIMLDRPRPDLSDERLRLAGTRFVLVEFPWTDNPPNSEEALGTIRSVGYLPIVSHPERYSWIAEGDSTIARWKAAGALLQVSLGSLVGNYGSRTRRTAWSLLEKGLADYLAGDFHGRGSHPLPIAKKAVLERGGAEQFDILTNSNPRRLLSGIEPVSVPAITVPSGRWWARFARGE